jgi:flagellar biosynthesis/type III secretory pathway chaperone
MMAVQLSKTADGASKKEVIKTLLKTERNFTLKKNERTISADVTEYNDIKALLERLVSKLPGVKG